MAAPPGGAGIVWQTPANPPEPHDYIIREGKYSQSSILDPRRALVPSAKPYTPHVLTIGRFSLKVGAT